MFYCKNGPKPATLFKKEALTQVFSCEASEIFQYLSCRTAPGDCFCGLSAGLPQETASAYILLIWRF